MHPNNGYHHRKRYSSDRNNHNHHPKVNYPPRKHPKNHGHSNYPSPTTHHKHYDKKPRQPYNQSQYPQQYASYPMFQPQYSTPMFFPRSTPPQFQDKPMFHPSYYTPRPTSNRPFDTPMMPIEQSSRPVYSTPRSQPNDEPAVVQDSDVKPLQTRVGWGEGLSKAFVKPSEGNQQQQKQSSTPIVKTETNQSTPIQPFNHVPSSVPFDQPGIPSRSSMLSLIEELDTRMLGRHNQIARYNDLEKLNLNPNLEDDLPFDIKVMNHQPLIEAVQSHAKVKASIARRFFYFPILGNQQKSVYTLPQPPAPRHRSSAGGIVEAVGVDPAFEVMIRSICKEIRNRHVKISCHLKEKVTIRKNCIDKIKNKRRMVYQAHRMCWLRDVSKMELLFTPLPQDAEKDPLALKVMEEFSPSNPSSQPQPPASIEQRKRVTRGTRQVEKERDMEWCCPPKESSHFPLQRMTLFRGIAICPEINVETELNKLSVTKEKVLAKPDYINTNGLIVDPVADFEDHKANKWTSDEILVFLELFKQYPNDFHRIKRALPNKSSFDVVEWYYLNKLKFLKTKVRRNTRDKRITEFDEEKTLITYSGDNGDGSECTSFYTIEGEELEAQS
ncbi:hypothetical protein P9112_012326 [Eukaryota sp. TZLM1-RC]